MRDLLEEKSLDILDSKFEFMPLGKEPIMIGSTADMKNFKYKKYLAKKNNNEFILQTEWVPANGSGNKIVLKKFLGSRGELKRLVKEKFNLKTRKKKGEIKLLAKSAFNEYFENGWKRETGSVGKNSPYNTNPLNI